MDFTPTLEDRLPRAVRSQETERLFAEAARAEGAERDRLLDEVILINTEVARAVARRFAGRGLALEDLEQVAMVALIRAARRFDPALQHDFLSYAVPTMSGEVKRHFRDQGWIVRPPRRVQELQSRVVALQGAGRDATGAPLDGAGLAERLGVGVGDVEESLMAQGCFQPVSLDGAGTGTERHALDVPCETGSRDVECAEARVILTPLLRSLDEQERRIVHLSYVESLSQREVGDQLGITQAQVSRRLARILDKLRRAAGTEPSQAA